jgi:hypothetical protein
MELAAFYATRKRAHTLGDSTQGTEKASAPVVGSDEWREPYLGKGEEGDGDPA